MGFRLFDIPGVGRPLHRSTGVVQQGSDEPPPWTVVSGRWCETEVQFRHPHCVWAAGDRVRFAEFGKSSHILKEAHHPYVSFVVEEVL